MIKVGNCPDSWGVWFDKNDRQMDWRRFTREFHEAGYRYTELGPFGYMSEDADELNEEFKKWDIVPVAGNIMFDLADDEKMEWAKAHTKKVCELLRAVGGEYFIIMDAMYDDLITGEHLRPKALDKEKFDSLIKNTVVLGKIAKECGIKSVFHPHAGTHVEYEDQIEEVLNKTTPDELMLCFDTGHHVYCEGNDVYSFMEKHMDRISFLHFKDVVESVKEEVWKNGDTFPVATKKGIWAEIGEGQIDWLKIKDILEKTGYDGYAIIEEDCYPAMFDEVLPKQKKIAEYMKSINMGTLK